MITSSVDSLRSHCLAGWPEAHKLAGWLAGGLLLQLAGCFALLC